MTQGEEAGGSVQSVERALQVLEALAGRQVAGVTELASAIGVHKSTASRLLATLDRHGFVVRDAEHTGYRLGPRLGELADAATGSARLLRAAHPVAERLAFEVGEVVNVAIFDDERIVDVDQVIADPQARQRDWTGRSTPVHATASGKVLLAWQPEARVARLLDGTLAKLTAATRTDPADLVTELKQVRGQGWATTVDELEDGLTAVSAPIFAGGGDVVAALTVSGPSARLGPERMDHVAALAAARAGEISAALGHGAPAADILS